MGALYVILSREILRTMTEGKLTVLEKWWINLPRTYQLNLDKKIGKTLKIKD